MVAITRTLAPSPAATGPSAKHSSPELDAKARTCRAQLADWVTCASAKTPEGKAKIEQISARLDSIKQEIKQSEGTSPSAPSSRQDASTALSASTGDIRHYRGATDRVGTQVDTYA